MEGECFGEIFFTPLLSLSTCHVDEAVRLQIVFTILCRGKISFLWRTASIGM